jgi:chaperonin GroES
MAGSAAPVITALGLTGEASRLWFHHHPPLLESTHMKVRPLHDRIIVQRLEEGEQKVGDIIIPDTAKEKPQQGKVFAVGAGKVREDGTRQPPDVQNGDTILFGKYSGQDIKIDGEDYLIMREDEVLAVTDSKGK